MRLRPAWVGLCIAVAGLSSGCQGHARGAAVGQGAAYEKATSGKLVVKALQAKDASKEAAAGIGVKLCTELAKLVRAELLCADELKNLFQHQEDLLTLGACEEQDCLTQLADRLHADFLVQGALDKVGGTWVLSLQLVDGKSGVIKSRLSREVSASDPEKLLDEVGPLARSLAEAL